MIRNFTKVLSESCKSPLLFKHKFLPAHSFSTSKVLYFDYQATTPTDQRVVDEMLPYFTEQYGNPHSKTHQFGWDTAKAVDKAR